MRGRSALISGPPFIGPSFAMSRPSHAHLHVIRDQSVATDAQRPVLPLAGF